MTGHHHSTSQQCPVCGSTSVDTDQVECRGSLLLGECLRCEYRWIRMLATPALHSPQQTPAPPARGALHEGREVASAA